MLNLRIVGLDALSADPAPSEALRPQLILGILILPLPLLADALSAVAVSVLLPIPLASIGDSVGGSPVCVQRS
jgi:hypothetical protein